MWARTLASGALIAATVAWTASTGQTKAFCRGYAAAGWSYLLLAHSDIAGKNLRSGRSYEELLHVHVAQTVRYALSGEATWLTDDLFALTFSFVFAMFVSCLAGAVAAQYADLRPHDRSSM
jgi:hypothetical protein